MAQFSGLPLSPPLLVRKPIFTQIEGLTSGPDADKIRKRMKKDDRSDEEDGLDARTIFQRRFKRNDRSLSRVTLQRNFGSIQPDELQSNVSVYPSGTSQLLL